MSGILGHHGIFFAVAGPPPAPPSTWNPADKDADVVLSSGDTIASLTLPGVGSVRGTQSRDASDDRCFAVTVGVVSSGGSTIGVGKSTANLASFPGQDADGYGYYGATGDKYTNNSGSAYGAAVMNSQSVLTRLHGGNLTFYVWNGSSWVSQGLAFTGLSGTFFPMWGIGGGTDGYTGQIQTTGIASKPSGSADWG